MIRIWGRPTSTCSERVLWALEEAGCPYELVLASNFMGPAGPVAQGNAPFGIVDTPEYLALNPNGTIPTIDDDGTIIWDSNAILVHIASKPGPLNATSRATLVRAIQWMGWANEFLEPPLHTLVMHVSRLRPDARDARKVEEARRSLVKPLGILDRHLGSQDFVCGPAFSIGDIPSGIDFHRLTVLGLEMPSFPRIAGWYERLKQRPAFQRHVAPAEFHI